MFMGCWLQGLVHHEERYFGCFLVMTLMVRIVFKAGKLKWRRQERYIKLKIMLAKDLFFDLVNKVE